MNLKELRKRKGLTQMDAAAICGVSLTCWILWEREINTPNEENMVKVKQLEALPDKE
jgi:DNA-binding XRE family transcriptional regulator